MNTIDKGWEIIIKGLDKVYSDVCEMAKYDTNINPEHLDEVYRVLDKLYNLTDNEFNKLCK
jgi:hypothetical protein